MYLFEARKKDYPYEWTNLGSSRFKNHARLMRIMSFKVYWRHSEWDTRIREV